MGGKRKRSRPGNGGEGDQKRQRIAGSVGGKGLVVKEALLAQYYQQVLTLREYLLLKLPTNSKIRKKKIKSVGRKGREEEGEYDGKLSTFLDQTLVGVSRCSEVSVLERREQWTTFSQRADESASTLANLNSPGQFSQTEIVDFAIWLIFSKNGRSLHLLCQGFRKDVTARSVAQGESGASALPGIVSTYPNSHVTSMKAYPWPRVLALLGKEGERAMLDLILECGIFLATGSGQETFHQLSGQPLGELNVLPQTSPKPENAVSKGPSNIKTTLRSPSDITFVRNRMLYARAALNAQGGVRFGLRHIHVLNRYHLDEFEERDTENGPKASRTTLQVMMYIFPRQFGLHNVFTNDVDTRQTVQPFQDYTLREDEINKKFPAPVLPKVPKRLRGKGVALIRKLQIQHSRCPYKKLLEYYCPVASESSGHNPPLAPQQSVDSTKLKNQSSILTTQGTVLIPASATKFPPRKPSMMDHATPNAMVSAFCRAAVLQLIPHEFWGIGDVQTHNEQAFHRNINRFIELRRFESLSLHEVSQGLKIGSIEWLGSSETAQKKLSQSDFHKRWEIFSEILYYLFDSLLIPLIRANFHVTESNVHRYRLFYFRHDVWKSLAEPALASLKQSMFEEVKLDKALNILESRTLGFSQVRLLPKETGIRPIMNLRRRTIKRGTKNLLGSSINSVLTPIYNVLTYEKTFNPSLLGSTLFSVSDLYTRLKAFKSALPTPTPSPSPPLYFAKVDVKSAFDTIPQRAVLQLISNLPSESTYRISKHVELKPGENHRSDPTSKPVRKWSALAHSADDLQPFDKALESSLAVGRKNAIFVENVVNQFRDTDELLTLLSEHVNNNMVKIGKRFYRQKEGIPQGSVLSSLLCNYFYADLESKHLSFLNSSSLLLRLIDDFLLITPDRSHAKQFLQIMHDGLPEYGVRVNPDKTLVNFEVRVNGMKVKRLVGGKAFPYCGSFIDTQTLDIRRDRERRKDMAVSDSLTVEFSKMPGKTFHRKVLNTFKIQSHAMFLDTSFNSLSTVLSNIYTAFIETATKMWTYAKCLPVGKQPGTRLLIKTIQDLIELAFVLMKSKGRNGKNVGYKCGVSKVQVEWLAINAFKLVLQKKQSKYANVLEWLDMRIGVLRVEEKDVMMRLRGVMKVETN